MEEVSSHHFWGESELKVWIFLCKSPSLSSRPRGKEAICDWPLVLRTDVKGSILPVIVLRKKDIVYKARVSG